MKTRYILFAVLLAAISGRAVAQLPSPGTVLNPKTILGDDLWAWGWAGYHAENLTVVAGPRGPIITFLVDLSGNGHHWFNNTGGHPGFQWGLSLPPSTKGGAYATPLPLIGIEEYSGGGEMYGNTYDQMGSLGATGEFYLAVVTMNTRTRGLRDLFGRDTLNVIRYEQRDDSLSLTIAGTKRKVVANGLLPHGILLLELWRDAAGEIVVFGNGQQISTPGILMPGNFAMTGFGYDGTGTGQHDDWLMELIVADGLPAPSNRHALRIHLMNKWDI